MIRSISTAWINATSAIRDAMPHNSPGHLRGSIVSGIFALGCISGAQAATVPGQSVVSDNGDGSFTFAFNALSDDIADTGLLFTNGAGLDLIVTGNNAGGGVADVIQDATPFAGLGVDHGPGVGNIGVGEVLTFAFNQDVNFLGFTLNGRYADAATGGFALRSYGPATLFAPASNFDGVGVEAMQQGVMCPSFDFLCGTSSFEITSDSFSGYLDTITVKIAVPAVPLPASGILLFAGLAGLGAWRRRMLAHFLCFGCCKPD